MPPAPISSGRSAGLGAYIKAAFTYHWNLLFFLGGSAGAMLSGRPDAFLPMVVGLELAYLTSLIALPRFRTSVDAAAAAKLRGDSGLARADDTAGRMSLQKMIDSLPNVSVQRFMALRNRCFEMRDIASGVRGQTAGASDSADSVRTPALDRLLFLFLKLLMSQNGLDRFLKSTSEKMLVDKLANIKARYETAKAAGDERVTRSLQDSVADAELRLDNYRKSMKDAEFVSIELDRIETKIQALTEMGVSRQDADALSHQVTAAAESMHQTEDAVNQLQHLTGLADSLAEPPAILEADLGAPIQRVR